MLPLFTAYLYLLFHESAKRPTYVPKYVHLPDLGNLPKKLKALKEYKFVILTIASKNYVYSQLIQPLDYRFLSFTLLTRIMLLLLSIILRIVEDKVEIKGPVWDTQLDLVWYIA